MQTIPQDLKIGYYIALLLSLLVILFVVLFVYIYRRKQSALVIEKKLIEANFQKELLQSQVEIQEQTFTNISQELHDNIGQSLALAKLNLNTISQIINKEDEEKIENSKTLISSTINNIRDIAKSMLGEKITEIGLEQAVKNEIKLINHTKTIALHFESINETFSLHPQQEVVAFRIIQEAIQNAIKHAQCSNITIAFNYLISALQIEIKDNGKGFEQYNLNNQETGIGLKNMQNRAKIINAEFKINSTNVNGTSILLTINKAFLN